MNPWKVLVVEDEDDSMELVCGILEYHQIETISASSGEDAIEMLKRGAAPDLIVVDLALPGIDGWGVLDFLKSNQTLARVPRVAITAFHSPELAHQVIEAGFDAYFPKPIDSTTFVRELERIVSG
ncbi:MAG: response regulator [Anaerolineae bacterium]|nr:response regulator [Anaerolineae bacterium]NUQ04523.1 response regulator [Anaerolineae bacterium]